ncbi:hypothetical protein IHE45_11G098900 [Dioscorea alata]|uniref:Uncharacterized protein n=2 Tax=Dioscorea alata TaxID=55571 RepID=A0ACB7V8L6_DIOAL|nr:hypothetical protein IHE45_11G098900 [Dioscorea alata]
MLEKLSKELMKTMIMWLSNNLDFWKAAEHGSGQCSCFEQFHLDVDFLVEVARLGGYFSDDLLTAVMDLLAQIEDKFAECESDMKSGAADDASPDDDWSSNAAKLAIEKLLKFEMLKLERKEETAVSSEEDLTQNAVNVSPSGDNVGSVDGESADSSEEDITRIETTGRDHDGTVKLKEEAEDVEEQDADEILNFSKHEPFGAAESARGVLIDLTERLDQALKFDFFDVSADLDTIVSHATTENKVVNSTSEIDEKIEQIVKLLLPAPEEYESVGKLDESFSITVQPEKDVQLVKGKSFGVGMNLELKSNILEVSDKSDETRRNTGTVETDEIKCAEKASVSRFLIDLEEEFVGNFDVSVDKTASESVREEPIGAQYLEMMFKLLEVSDNVDADLSHATGQKTGAFETSEIEHSKETYTRVFPEESFIGELEEFANGTAQSVRGTALALANIENLVSIDKLTKEIDHPDRYISDLINSAEKIHTVLTEDSSSETSSKEANFIDTLTAESANRNALTEVEDIEKEKVLVGNAKEKINDESFEKQDKDDAGNIRASKTKLNELPRSKRKRERPRTVINVEHLGRTKRGPATPRPRWT